MYLPIKLTVGLFKFVASSLNVIPPKSILKKNKAWPVRENTKVTTAKSKALTSTVAR